VFDGDICITNGKRKSIGACSWMQYSHVRRVTVPDARYLSATFISAVKGDGGGAQKLPNNVTGTLRRKLDMNSEKSYFLLPIRLQEDIQSQKL
jgi:hypothetical protein